MAASAGRLQMAKREVLAEAEGLSITESLVGFPSLDDWFPNGGIEAAHDRMDAALAAYVTAYLEEHSA